MSDLSDEYNDPAKGRYVEFQYVANIGVGGDNPQIGAVMIDHRSADKEPHAVSETTAYEMLQKESAWRLTIPGDMHERSIIESEVWAFTLANIQAEKMKDGVALDVPFTPHPNVLVEDPDLEPETP